jgi:2'-5' RNA ligase
LTADERSPRSQERRIRAFVALELAAAMRARIEAAVAPLRPSIADARWTQVASLHLTLRFLGPTTQADRERLEPMLRAAAAACPASEAHVRGAGTFPERGSPRVLWLGIVLPPPLLALQAACEAAAVACGFEPEQRPYRPHLTLARWRDHARRPELPPLDLGRARFDSLVLLRSDLGPRGAVYTPLAAYPLGA